MATFQRESDEKVFDLHDDSFNKNNKGRNVKNIPLLCFPQFGRFQSRQLVKLELNHGWVTLTEPPDWSTRHSIQ